MRDPKTSSRLAALTFLALSFVPLAACSNSVMPEFLTKVQVVRDPVPAPLLECEEFPPQPSEPVTAEAVGDFIVDSFGAWNDCRNKLASIKALQAQP